MKYESNRGFSLVEIIISIGLAAIFLPGVVSLLSLGITASSQGEKFSQGYALAQENMEAVFSLKESGESAWDWVLTPDNTEIGEFYQPSKVLDAWQLGAITTEPVAEGAFVKKVEITPVRRCGTQICEEEWGEMDFYSRKIAVYVSWTEKGEDQEVKIESYVTKH